MGRHLNFTAVRSSRRTTGSATPRGPPYAVGSKHIWRGARRPDPKEQDVLFYSYEGRRDATSTGKTRIVPLATLGQGIINYTYCTDAACNATPQASLNLAQNQQAYQAAGINPAAAGCTGCRRCEVSSERYNSRGSVEYEWLPLQCSYARKTKLERRAV